MLSKWFTGIVGFEYGDPDGSPQLELIHVHSIGPGHARHDIEQEHKRQLVARMNNETWTDEDEPDPEYAEREYEVFIPEGMEDISEYRNYGPRIFYVFEGKLEDVGY